MLSKLGSALPDSIVFALLAALGLFTAIAACLGWYAARPVKRQLEQARKSLDQGDIQISLPLIGSVAPALNELNKRSDSLRRVDAEIDTIDQMGTS
jgi:HAMP domain-containing protein